MSEKKLDRQERVILAIILAFMAAIAGKYFGIDLFSETDKALDTVERAEKLLDEPQE